MHQVVAYKRLKTMEIINRQAQKVVTIAYRRCLFTRGSNCEALTGKILVFWIGGCLWEVVAHGDLTEWLRHSCKWELAFTRLSYPNLKNVLWESITHTGYPWTDNPLLACVVDGLFYKRAHLATLQLICTCKKQNHQLCWLPIQLL